MIFYLPYYLWLPMFFILTWGYSFYYFFSSWRTSFSISYSRGWYAGNKFSVFLYLKGTWFCLHFWSILSLDMELWIHTFFSFQHIKNIVPLSSSFYRLALFWNVFSLHILCWFSLDEFKNVSWIFSRLIMLCLIVNMQMCPFH